MVNLNLRQIKLLFLISRGTPLHELSRLTKWSVPDIHKDIKYFEGSGLLAYGLTEIGRDLMSQYAFDGKDVYSVEVVKNREA